MSKIGHSDKSNGGGLGVKIDTMSCSNVNGLRGCISDKPNAPNFEGRALTSARSWVKIGALFEQTIRSSGESFYQGRLDDPSMSSPKIGRASCRERVCQYV